MNVIIFGPPGAGKGTQAQNLVNKFNLYQASTGDLLRAEVAAASPLGLEAQEVMNRGELVSDSLVLSIVEKRLLIHKYGWLLDGFPRTLIQATALEPLLEELKQPIEAVVLLELNDAVLIERLISRGRSDDNESVIRNRLEVYREKTAPLIDHYRQQGLLQTVEAHGSSESIAISIEKSLC